MTGPITPGSGRHFVVDASAVVALLTDAGPAGEWVTGIVHRAALSAPELMQYEAANVLRRHAATPTASRASLDRSDATAGSLDASAAALAHDHLISLGIEFYPYLVTARRVWELRQNLTVYDASYVALAEQLDAPLVTLDARIARATGPRCQVMAYQPPSTPPR